MTARRGTVVDRGERGEPGREIRAFICQGQLACVRQQAGRARRARGVRVPAGDRVGRCHPSVRDSSPSGVAALTVGAPLGFCAIVNGAAVGLILEFPINELGNGFARRRRSPGAAVSASLAWWRFAVSFWFLCCVGLFLFSRARSFAGERLSRGERLLKDRTRFV